VALARSQSRAVMLGSSDDAVPSFGAKTPHCPHRALGNPRIPSFPEVNPELPSLDLHLGLFAAAEAWPCPLGEAAVD
jgi:hypothetical protein